MSTAYRFAFYCLFLIVAGGGGYLLREHLGARTDSSTPTLVGQARPDFLLKDFRGESRRISEWNGKVLLLNFWATWCPPCQKEIPELIALQEDYKEEGLQIVGIAIDELGTTQKFANKAGINYPTLTGEEEAIQVAVSYGNTSGALPYTVIVDRNKRIAFTQRGQVRRDEIENLIRRLLRIPA
ncbi:MAG: TlpA family protein disulfide reductase [Gammaproteobacteria bacterium]|nr:TlpA family protein disulfide reductase [Gammaproteobacteria bacterium]